MGPAPTSGTSGTSGPRQSGWVRYLDHKFGCGFLGVFDTVSFWRITIPETNILLMVLNPQRKPVEVGSLSLYVQGFSTIPGGCLEFLPVAAKRSYRY